VKKEGFGMETKTLAKYVAELQYEIYREEHQHGQTMHAGLVGGLYQRLAGKTNKDYSQHSSVLGRQGRSKRFFRQ
jgi:hypothetical protein